MCEKYYTLSEPGVVCHDVGVELHGMLVIPLLAFA